MLPTHTDMDRLKLFQSFPPEAMQDNQCSPKRLQILLKFDRDTFVDTITHQISPL